MNLQRDAARLASIATIFVWVGWLFVLYALIAGILWWIDLAGREAFSFLEAFAISAAAIGDAALPGPDRGRPRTRSPALRPVRRQQVPVTRWRGEIHMFIRRLARRVAALGGVMLLVAACSTAAAAPEDVDGQGGEIQGDVLGPAARMPSTAS